MNKLILTKDNLKNIIVLIIGIIFYGIIRVANLSLQNSIKVSLIYIMFAYCYLLIEVIRKRGISNIYFFILIMSIFFFYGQHIIVLIHPEYFSVQNFHILDRRIPDEKIIDATYMIIFSLLCIHIRIF